MVTQQMTITNLATAVAAVDKEADMPVDLEVDAMALGQEVTQLAAAAAVEVAAAVATEVAAVAAEAASSRM
jgi:hypothetical protein